MDWFGKDNSSYNFNMFSLSHIVVFVIFILIAVVIFLYRKNLTSTKWRKIEVGIAISLILIEIANQVWMYVNGIWKVGRSMPLELCNISLILSVILLFTRKKLVFELLFFIAILGVPQAIFTPALTFEFPHFRFFHFFYAHLLVVWVTLYFTWARKYYPTFGTAIKMMIFINLLLPVILFVNKTANGNYWFLRHKPDGPSLLDLLGPYPWYIFTLESLVIVPSLIVWLISRKREKKIRRTFT